MYYRMSYNLRKFLQNLQANTLVSRFDVYAALCSLEYHPCWKGNNHEIYRWILANARWHDSTLCRTSARC